MDGSGLAFTHYSPAWLMPDLSAATRAERKRYFLPATWLVFTIKNTNSAPEEFYFGAVNVRKTRHAIPTGIVADRKSFAATPVFFARAYCPICRTEHEWFAREAWVCEAEPRRRQGALA